MHPVGGKKPNGFGLHDMHGNVWEWCEDAWHESYRDEPEELFETGGAWTTWDGKLRVLRGGSWNSNPLFRRAARRFWISTEGRSNRIGFRVARTLFTPPESLPFAC